MRHIWLVLVAILVPAFAGCIDDGSLTTRLHVISAEQAAFTETDEPGIYTLTLNGASDAVTWFTDQPDPESGIESLEDFSMSTWQQVLAGESPTGAIAYQDADGYWSMAPFKALGLDAGSEASGVTWRLEMKGVPDAGTLRDVHLYLDDRGVSETDEGDSSVFLHGAAGITFEQGESDGLYTLRLAYPYSSVSVIQTGSGFGVYQLPIAEYIDVVWADDFVTNPPNAAIQLEGLDGVTYVTIAVLSNPAYDPETNELTYDAELLSGDPVVTSGPGVVFIDDWSDDDDATRYKVLVNYQNNYSVYPADLETPTGWTDTGMTGTLEECREYIIAAWSDMRPLSLADEMVEMASAAQTTRAGVSMRGNIAVVTVHGELTAEGGCLAFNGAIEDAVIYQPQRVVVDMSDVPAIDSEGLSALLHAFSAVRIMMWAKGDHLVLVNVSQPVMDYLVDANVATIFDIYDTLDEALAALGG